MLGPDGFINLSCIDHDKMEPLFSTKKKIKQGRTIGDLMVLNIARQYLVDRIQLTFAASM